MNVLLVFTIVFSLFSFEKIHADSFVDRCLGDTQILSKNLACEVKGNDGFSIADFTLEQGTKILVRTNGLFGKRDDSYAVFKIVHIPARMGDLIVQLESVQFRARDGLTTAVLTIPCHQTALASLGAARVSGDDMPTEQIAGCALR